MEDSAPNTNPQHNVAKHVLERRSSKSRLSKQIEVEEEQPEEEDNSPSSENSDATIVPTAGSDIPAETSPGGSPDTNSPEETKKIETTVSDDENNDENSQNQKVKFLVRSQALCDDASPPPEEQVVRVSCSSPQPSSGICEITNGVSLLALQPGSYGHAKLEKDGSLSSMSDSGNSLTSPCLSRDSSIEAYTDSTGIDLEEFIKMTLNKNPKDRMMLLKLEQDLTTFISENKHEYLKFPQMSSYHRMLVHRISAFFGLDHNVDQSGKCVMVNQTSSTRIPDFKFRDYIQDASSQDEFPKKQILKRENSSFDDGMGLDRMMNDKQNKSYEEREQEYKQARDRIFSQQDSQTSQDGSLESPMSQRSRRISKEELRWNSDLRPWSSTDSSGYSTDTSSRFPHVTKASSFSGGCGVSILSRSESRGSSISRGAKTDSLSSGISSLGSPMTRPPTIPSSPPPDGQLSESGSSTHSAASPSQMYIQDSQTYPFDAGQNMIVWVASSVDVIPPGALIINPETGQPYNNADGSLYRFQPPHLPMTKQHSIQRQLSSGSCSSPPPSASICNVQAINSSSSFPSYYRQMTPPQDKIAAVRKIN